ncbi:MAG TPA: phage holin family protein [Terrimicrobiaceae bacterium]
MAETVLSPSADARETPHGVVPELLRFAGSFGGHVQGLLQLAGLESKEAAFVGLRLLVLLIAGVVLGFFGYLLGLFFVVFLLAIVFGVAWIWILLGLAVLHLVAVAVCAILIRNYLRTPVFKATAAELKRDFEALKKLKE